MFISATWKACSCTAAARRASPSERTPRRLSPAAASPCWPRGRPPSWPTASLLLHAGTGADTLTDGVGTDALFGGDGADWLDGGAGAGLLLGGLGNDRYIVDDAGDRISEAGGGGVDTVVSSLSFTLGASIENLTLSGTASLTGTGNGAGNRMLASDAGSALAGLAGRDTLIGGAGEDVLAGGSGADRLTGGAGADHFRYGFAGEGGDNVTDFLRGSDVVEVLPRASAAGSPPAWTCWQRGDS
ncbi:calcium-binding protein [Roseomonas sp. GCM10028921]